jgi:hypothetical protein
METDSRSWVDWQKKLFLLLTVILGTGIALAEDVTPLSTQLTPLHSVKEYTMLSALLSQGRGALRTHDLFNAYTTNVQKAIVELQKDHKTICTNNVDFDLLQDISEVEDSFQRLVWIHKRRKARLRAIVKSRKSISQAIRNLRSNLCRPMPIGSVIDIDSSSNTVVEGAQVGSSTGIQVTAIDPNGEDSIKYILVNDEASAFNIDEDSGLVSVAGELDFETAQSHSLLVRAVSSDGSSSEAAFAISVEDIPTPDLQVHFPPRFGIARDEVPFRGVVSHPENSIVAITSLSGTSKPEVASNGSFSTSVKLTNPRAEESIRVQAAIGSESSDSLPFKFDTRPLFDGNNLCFNSVTGKLVSITFDKLYEIDPVSGDYSVKFSFTTEPEPILNYNNSCRHSARTGKYLVADRGFGLLAIDDTTGSITTIASNTLGTGPLIAYPTEIHLALDDTNQQAYISLNRYSGPVNGFGFQSLSSRVLKVDLLTGNRTIVFNRTGTANDEPFSAISGVDYDEASGLIYFVLGRIVFSVDPLTLTATRISSPVIGSGPALDPTNTFTCDFSNGNAYVTSGDCCGVSTRRLTKISLTDGVREDILLDQDFNEIGLIPEELYFNANDSELLVTDPSHSQIIRVNPSDNSPDPLIKQSSGTGSRLDSVQDAELAATLGNLFVSTSEGLVSIDMNNGERTLVSSATIGTGPTFFGRYNSFEFSDTENQGFLLARSTENVFEFAIYAVNITNGDRDLVLDHTSPGATALAGYANDLIYARESGKLYLLTSVGLYEVIRETGQVNGLPIQGAVLSFSDNADYVPADNSLLLYNAGSGEILKINLESGIATAIASATVGDGSPIGFVESLAYDSETNAIYVFDASSSSIVRIDGATLNRTTVPGTSADPFAGLVSVNTLVLGKNRTIYAVEELGKRVNLVDLDVSQ